MRNKNILIISVLIGILIAFIIPLPVPVSQRGCEAVNNCCSINPTHLNLNCGIYWVNGVYYFNLDSHTFGLMGILGLLTSTCIFFLGNFIKIKFETHPKFEK